MTWTPKERILAVLNREIPDRVSIFDLLINDDILKFFGGEFIPTGNRESWIKACSKCLDLCHPIIDGMPFEPRKILLPDGMLRVYER